MEVGSVVVVGGGKIGVRSVLIVFRLHAHMMTGLRINPGCGVFFEVCFVSVAVFFISCFVSPVAWS